MPKRSLEVQAAMPAVPPPKVQKTERSHEENQERAYIAASRRADRSLEARVQSARMASEIHRRRTGRGLKVTEEIVIKEEMYEEEEDDMPRQFRYLTQHLQTNSPALNQRVNAYVTTQAAMATMARYNEVNRLFNESFPSTSTFQQQLNQSMYMTPLMGSNTNNNVQFSPASPTISSPTESGHFTGGGRRPTAATVASTTAAHTVGTTASSPPALSPASETMDSPDVRSTTYQTPQPFPPIDPQLQQTTSSFTSTLPNEIKLLGMANIDMNDPMAPYFFGGNPGNYPDFSSGTMKPDLASQRVSTTTPPTPNEISSPHSSVEPNDETLFSPIDGFTSHFDDMSRFDNPSGGFNDTTWDNLIDFGSEQ